MSRSSSHASELHPGSSRWPEILLKVAVVAGAAGFAYVFGQLSIDRFLTFNSSIDDLGLWNQILWTTVHGGPSAWAAHSQANFYFLYPYQDSTLFVLVPFYWVYQSPVTLLVIQSILLGGAAVPLYFLARAYDLRPWVAAIVVAVFLLDYQLEGIVLNDFHIQTAFPFFFFLGALLLKTRHTTAFVPVALLAALTDPLDLGVILAFCLAPAILIGVNRPGLFEKVRSFFGGLLRSPQVLVVVLVLVGAFGLFFATGDITNYHFAATTLQGSQPVSTYLDSVPMREIFFVMLLAPFMGLPLLRAEPLITALPLLAYVVVADVNIFNIYGSVDVPSFVAVFGWGFVVGLSRLHPSLRDNPTPQSQSYHEREAPRTFLQVGRRRLTPYHGVPLVALLVTLLLLASYSPLSPFNNHGSVLQGYDQKPAQITTITDADTFLKQAIALIPPAGSVLTQNNMVQLTGRPDLSYVMPDKPTGNVTSFQYILGDNDSSNQNTRFWFGFLYPYIVEAYQTGLFGTLAFGHGIILIERGYRGAPALTSLPTEYPASSLALYSGFRNGTTDVHTGPSEFAFWYGPYVALPPGNYTVRYELRVNQNWPAYVPAIQLTAYQWPNGASSPDRFGGLQVYLGSFPAADQWMNFTLAFHLANYTGSVQFPGLSPAANISLEIASITLSRAGSENSSMVFPTYILPSEFRLYSGSTLQGPVAVHSGPTAYAFWYGPYLNMSAGNYSATFMLAAAPITPAMTMAIHLESYVWGAGPNASALLFASMRVYLGYFNAPGEWTNFTLNFSLGQSVRGLELVGLAPAANVTLQFGGCRLDVVPG